MRLVLAAAIPAFAIAALASHGAMAQRVSADGNRLLSICSGHGEASGCEAYIDGVADAAVGYQDIAKSPAAGLTVPREICVPAAITGRQLRESTVAWLQSHQGDRGQPAALIVLRMLHSNFPCK